MATADTLKLRSFIQAVKDIGYLIADVEPELDGCKGMETDMMRIEQWSRVLTNPEFLAMDLMDYAWMQHAQLMEEVNGI